MPSKPLWRQNPGAVKAPVPEGHTDLVTCMCVVDVRCETGVGGAGGTVQRMLTGLSDNTLLVWDVERGQPLSALNGVLYMDTVLYTWLIGL